MTTQTWTRRTAARTTEASALMRRRAVTKWRCQDSGMTQSSISRQLVITQSSLNRQPVITQTSLCRATNSRSSLSHHSVITQARCQEPVITQSSLSRQAVITQSSLSRQPVITQAFVSHRAVIIRVSIRHQSFISLPPVSHDRSVEPNLRRYGANTEFWQKASRNDEIHQIFNFVFNFCLCKNYAGRAIFDG